MMRQIGQPISDGTHQSFHHDQIRSFQLSDPQHYTFLVSEFEFDQIFRGFLNGAFSIGLTPIAIRTVVVERWHLTLTH